MRSEKTLRSESVKTMTVVEAWGTGLQRIQSAVREYGLPEPEFVEMSESFRVNLYRTHDVKTMNVGENVGNVGENVGETTDKDGDVKETILQFISENNRTSAVVVAKALSVSPRTIERYIRELRAESRLVRHGTARGGYWEVKEL